MVQVRQKSPVHGKTTNGNERGQRHHSHQNGYTSRFSEPKAGRTHPIVEHRPGVSAPLIVDVDPSTVLNSGPQLPTVLPLVDGGQKDSEEYTEGKGQSPPPSPPSTKNSGLSDVPHTGSGLNQSVANNTGKMVEPKGSKEAEAVEDKKSNSAANKVGLFDNLRQTNATPAARYVPKQEPVYVIQRNPRNRRKTVIAQKQYQAPAEPQNTFSNNNQQRYNKQDGQNGRSNEKAARQANKQPEGPRPNHRSSASAKPTTAFDMESDFPPLAKSSSSSSSNFRASLAGVKSNASDRDLERERTLTQQEFDKLAETPEPSNKPAEPTPPKPASKASSISANNSPRDSVPKALEEETNTLASNGTNAAPGEETVDLLSNISNILEGIVITAENDKPRAQSIQPEAASPTKSPVSQSVRAASHDPKMNLSKSQTPESKHADVLPSSEPTAPKAQATLSPVVQKQTSQTTPKNSPKPKESDTPTKGGKKSPRNGPGTPQKPKDGSTYANKTAVVIEDAVLPEKAKNVTSFEELRDALKKEIGTPEKSKFASSAPITSTVTPATPNATPASPAITPNASTITTVAAPTATTFAPGVSLVNSVVNPVSSSTSSQPLSRVTSLTESVSSTSCVVSSASYTSSTASSTVPRRTTPTRSGGSEPVVISRVNFTRQNSYSPSKRNSRPPRDDRRGPVEESVQPDSRGQSRQGAYRRGPSSNGPGQRHNREHRRSHDNRNGIYPMSQGQPMHLLSMETLYNPAPGYGIYQPPHPQAFRPPPPRPMYPAAPTMPVNPAMQNFQMPPPPFMGHVPQPAPMMPPIQFLQNKVDRSDTSSNSGGSVTVNGPSIARNDPDAVSTHSNESDGVSTPRVHSTLPTVQQPSLLDPRSYLNLQLLPMETITMTSELQVLLRNLLRLHPNEGVFFANIIDSVGRGSRQVRVLLHDNNPFALHGMSIPMYVRPNIDVDSGVANMPLQNHFFAKHDFPENSPPGMLPLINHYPVKSFDLAIPDGFGIANLPSVISNAISLDNGTFQKPQDLPPPPPPPQPPAPANPVISTEAGPSSSEPVPEPSVHPGN
uniref:Microtubule-associated protein n=1 Tax=Panagrellus redivivus TaxID=6233 RepID=A0A7E4W309_PANRE